MVDSAISLICTLLKEMSPRGLVPNALQVGNHLQRRGDLPQISGHGLLLQEQPHAQAFNLPLFLVNLQLNGLYLFGQLHVVFQQGLGHRGDGVLAQGAGGDQRHIELLQLLVKFRSHIPARSFLYQPNRPVM